MNHAFDTARINLAHQTRQQGDRLTPAPIPQEGEVWQHQKHDEAAGKFHQYKILCVTEPGKCPYQNSPAYFTCIDTETGEWYDVMPAEGDPSAPEGDRRCWLWPAQNQAYVVYQNIIPELHGGKVWARPLENFCGDRNGQPRFTRESSHRVAD